MQEPKKKTRVRNYFETTLFINVFLIVIFGGSVFLGGKDVTKLPVASSVLVEEKTDTAIENNEIQYLSDYVAKSDTFDASMVVNAVQSKDLPTINYESNEGVYTPFRSLIDSDGSVTGLVLELKDSAKANLLRDVLSLIEVQSGDKVTTKEGYETIDTYRDYLAKQLGITSDDARAIIKYSNGVFNLRDDSTFMSKVLYVFIAFSSAMLIFVTINIVGSVIGLRVCKKDEQDTEKSDDTVTVSGIQEVDK